MPNNEELQTGTGNIPIERQQLYGPLDINSRRVLKEEVTASMIDSLWDGIFYYKNKFEFSLEGLFVCGDTEGSGSGGNCGSGIATPGVLFMTTTTSTAESHTEYQVIGVDGIDFEHQQKFRASLSIGGSNPPNPRTVYITRGSKIYASQFGYYGFRVVNLKLQGILSDGITEQIVDIQNIELNQHVILEARFYPGNKVAFLVDGVQKQTLTIPASVSLPNSNIFYEYMIIGSASDSGFINSNFFEYIQAKDPTIQ